MYSKAKDKRFVYHTTIPPHCVDVHALLHIVWNNHLPLKSLLLATGCDRLEHPLLMNWFLTYQSSSLGLVTLPRAGETILHGFPSSYIIWHSWSIWCMDETFLWKYVFPLVSRTYVRDRRSWRRDDPREMHQPNFSILTKSHACLQWTIIVSINMQTTINNVFL